MVETGDQAPRFTLPDGEFRPFALKAYLGRPVLLAFFPAAFSPVCTREILALQARLQRFDAGGAQVAGISVDGPYALNGFAQQHDVRFPLLSDFHRETIRAYGVEDPNFLGLQGVVRYRCVADRPGSEPDYEELLLVVQRVGIAQAP